MVTYYEHLVLLAFIITTILYSLCWYLWHKYIPPMMAFLSAHEEEIWRFFE